MIVCRRYRLLPHANQEAVLNHQLESLRRLWNHALGDRQAAWDERRESTTYRQQCLDLTIRRRDDPSGIGAVSAQVAQAQLRRLDYAFRRFFKGITQHPRPKEFGEQMSLTFPQAYNRSVVVGGRSGKIRLAGVGYIRFIRHRDEPTNGSLKTCTVKQEGGHWYAILTYCVPDNQKPSGAIEAPIGIDLGLKNLITLNNGETVAPPKFLARAERRLRLAQRTMDRRKKGSSNRLRARRRLARCHAKVRRQRTDFLHKLSDNLVKRFDLIAMEDMDVAQMKMKGFRNVRRGIVDAGWGKLRLFVAYKTACAGKRFALVPASGTTQVCSTCGTVPTTRLTLSDRTHSCPCGKVMDRDINAAKNILARGLAALSTAGHAGIDAFGEVGPPVAAARGRRVYSMNEEPPPRDAV